jgi:hypothetical protein
MRGLEGLEGLEDVAVVDSSGFEEDEDMSYELPAELPVRPKVHSTEEDTAAASELLDELDGLEAELLQCAKATEQAIGQLFGSSEDVKGTANMSSKKTTGKSKTTGKAKATGKSKATGKAKTTSKTNKGSARAQRTSTKAQRSAPAPEQPTAPSSRFKSVTQTLDELQINTFGAEDAEGYPSVSGFSEWMEDLDSIRAGLEEY